jgi:hypothetical protein
LTNVCIPLRVKLHVPRRTAASLRRSMLDVGRTSLWGYNQHARRPHKQHARRWAARASEHAETVAVDAAVRARSSCIILLSDLKINLSACFLLDCCLKVDLKPHGFTQASRRILESSMVSRLVLRQGLLACSTYLPLGAPSLKLSPQSRHTPGTARPAA